MWLSSNDVPINAMPVTILDTLQADGTYSSNPYHHTSIVLSAVFVSSPSISSPCWRVEVEVSRFTHTHAHVRARAQTHTVRTHARMQVRTHAFFPPEHKTTPPNTTTHRLSRRRCFENSRSIAPCSLLPLRTYLRKSWEFVTVKNLLLSQQTFHHPPRPTLIFG